MKAALLLLAVPALAMAAAVKKRDPSVSCGGTSYSSDQVATCISNGNDGDGGSSDYPHRYKDYEGFDFSGYCSDSTYYEYPLTADGYSGGRPGADRCIYGADSGSFCGAITHTGTSAAPRPSSPLHALCTPPAPVPAVELVPAFALPTDKGLT